MIAAVLKKCIFFLLEQTGRWRGEEPRHPKPLTEPPSSQAGHVKSTLYSGAVGLIGGDTSRFVAPSISRFRSPGVRGA